MVLLTITPGILRALESASNTYPDHFAKLQHNDEPSLSQAKLGDAVSHTQLIALSKLLKQHSTPRPDTPSEQGQDVSNNDTPLPPPATLASLLHSTTIYTPPPAPKPAPTPEYTALMARLRRDQEALSYSRLLNPPTRESFSQRFPAAPSPFTTHIPPSSLDDEITYEEVHRQIILIINILVSIVAVSVFLWVAARHWSIGKRLGLAMGGSLAIAVAEVAVYGGYVRKVKEAKLVERRKPEIKEIVQTWRVGGAKNAEAERVDVGGKGKGDEVDGVRFRKGKHR
ncbi:hypothetical protein IAQ61_006377 [Plenodomus lingam]|uniref:Endoplasmic reticulum-based factor for assembly of V-ATPase-domain-containing protein n=1 Tax=Leptosphaeria maculans (strain JN3 / isolate v23.1.3 / race Av1-4-5-6-7-8) TaxID=985895 RepID=E4ZS76_LEPMJ|nr:hypothetical protein LEMA_P122350.1 [Plenodomus lingam JN3]KAH9869172.1 hypothetical protein IAQ61_006377 [Plenodomus lingam]CBX94256.1 hypothetical protein LEMA_P122350.1 [Plenodomus lingam JN3]